MGLLKRLAGFLGLAKDEELEKQVGQENGDPNMSSSSSRSSTSAPTTTLPPFAHTHLNRKGFSVPVQVPVDRPPVLLPSSSNQAGLQGLRWFARRLKIDEDGDVADEFFEEVLPAMQENTEGDHKPVPKIEVKFIPRPAKVRNQVLSPEGKLQHCVEYQGRLQWV